jgi:adenine-specific DNA-methyltransferase
MDKLKMHSLDMTADNIEKIAAIFPNCVTESANALGGLKKSIDFDLLKQELSGSIVDGTQERYHLNWPGKREALLTANAPIAKTLLPNRDESINFDTTENLFIEGDNLEALKLLQETYLGKVKMIYIDPPYNTGADFIYDDDFRESSDEYLKRSNQKDNEGNRLISNTEGNGRFHSDWLSMIAPRIKLARNLLSDDGMIFISIHDVEVANLKKICEEVFGTENFVGQITWKARVKPVNIGEAKYRPQREVEYIIVYQKSNSKGAFYPLYTGSERTYPHTNKGRKYRLTTILKSNRGTNHRTTMSFSLGDYSPPEGQRWQAGKDVIEQLNKDEYLEFRDCTPFKRYYEDEEGAEHDPFYCFMAAEWSSTSEAGKSQLNDLIGQNHGFDTVKPSRLIKTLIQSCTSPKNNHIVLDFFGGSGTTAHAVMEQNIEDGGNRKFILVQVKEESSAKVKSEFSYIPELTRKRIVESGLTLSQQAENDVLDIGFRTLKIDTSNMKDVYYNPEKTSQEDMFAQIENIKEDRTDEDLLFQVLLDWGVGLTLPISKQQISGKNVFFVNGDSNGEGADLIGCFSKNITDDLVKELAKLQPLRVVFRDDGFGDGFDADAIKINAEQIFKQLSPATDIKSL